MKVHHTAIISPDAQLEEGVEVGPYVVIGSDVKIGKNTIIGPHTVIEILPILVKTAIFFNFVPSVLLPRI